MKNFATKNSITANQLSGKAIGALFFSGFGAVWILLALYCKEILTPANIAWAALNLFVLLAGAAWLFRKARRFPKMPEDPALSRAFHRINILQWIAIAIVSTTFARLHISVYVLSAITAIVGLHLFPLARLFRAPLHYVTGSVLTAWAALSAIFLPTDHLQGTTALGTGIVLWISAFLSLTLAATQVRHAERSHSTRQTIAEN